MEASTRSTFVVRTPGSWSLAPVPGRTPTPTDVTEILRLAEADDAEQIGPRSGPATSPRRPTTLSPDDLIAPVWTIVGRVVAGGVLLEAHDGGQLVLDATDVLLLDALNGVMRVDELPVTTVMSMDERCRRLGRMLAAGRIRNPKHSRPVSTAPAEPAVELPVEPAAEPAAEPTAEPTDVLAPTAGGLRAAFAHSRLGEAFRLSSKVRAVRRAGASVRSRITGRGPVAASPPAALVASEPGPGEPEVTPTPSADDLVVPLVIDDPPATTTEAKTPAHGASRPVTPDPRVPVYAMWHEHVGPLLSLGMLTAAARDWNGGALNDRFEIRRPETATSLIEDLGRRPGPAVLLCSDYVWSATDNLAVAQQACALNPELVVVHGGPSCPAYEGDAEVFLRAHGRAAGFLVRGEGEDVLAELLDVLGDSMPDLDVERLRGIAGISFLDPESNSVVRTPDRDRIADLDSLPSPYLTGEFDDIPGSAWNYCLSIETTRGCPYGCTFCDWGSATMSRIRKFDIDRVTAELQWAAERGVHAIQITDANFGIMSRDVETARRVAEIKQSTGFPQVLSWTPAKNTTRHLTQIMAEMIDAGLIVNSSLSLQSTDEATLDALDRSNISTDHFVSLAADYRRRGHPLQGDLMLGLPEQNFDTYKRDIQFFLDHEIMVRTWPVQILPNSPMNDPEYRERYGLTTDERNLVVSTTSFGPDDRARMFRLRNIDIITERLGVLRHPMRFLQWQYGIEATDVMEDLLEVVETEPDRFPVLTWVLEYFDIHPTVALGWTSFYDEFRSFVAARYPQVAHDSAFECVVQLQQFLMPAPGRSFPATITLAHDYVAWYRAATRSLYTTGHAGTPEDALADLGPTEFTVTGDPLDLCVTGIRLDGDSRDEILQGDFHIGAAVANELESPLIRILPALCGQAGPLSSEDIVRQLLEELEAEDDADAGGVPVALTRKP